MTTLQATTSSPEVLFDAPSASSLELSFSTPHATSADLLEDSKTSTHATDEAEGATQNGLKGDINDEKADNTSSKELEGLRSVNLTPTSPSSEATHIRADVIPETDERRNSSPPIVLKSVPGTPSGEQTRLDDLVENSSAAPSHNANVNGLSSGSEEDLDDPRALVISSLRAQISDLFSQVNLLNSKLVQSYDRVSTLEETLDDNTEKLQALEGERMNLEREKNVLELERTKQEQMVKDGRLVERSAVATELRRLMEESLASSSAKQSAEAKHKQMESELSDLSANLFSTANEMVATERQARARAEESLASTRATAATVEKQLEAAKLELSREENEKEVLRDAKAKTEQEMAELRRAMRGVNSSNVTSLGSGGVLRMMNSHLPYKNEYLGFLAHLRGLAASTPNIPAITSLLTLPFLARLAVEDSEPTLRLDLAPSLNWLTRRSVLAAVHSNTLLIEQIHVATLFLEGSSSSYSYVGFGSGSSLPTSPTQLTKVNCALCGKIVYMSPEAIQAEENRNQSSVVITESPTTPTTNSIPNSTTPSPQRIGSGGGWAASKFLKSVTLPSLGSVVAGGSRSNSPTPRHTLDSTTANGSGPSTPTATALERPPSPPPPTSLQTVIHAFRVPLSSKSATGSSSNLPASAIDPSQPSETYGPPYPLCHTGWCLARLKATCELWGCVRTDVVERVWKDGAVERRRLGTGSSAEMEELGSANVEKALPSIAQDSPSGPAMNDSTAPPGPPKRKMADLWGMGKDVLDKAKAYGNTSSGADRIFPSASPVSTTGDTSSFFGGVRRTFSGSAIIANSTNSMTPMESTRDRSSSSEGLVKTSDPMGTVKTPPLPKRNTSRLSAVFTGPPEVAGGTREDDIEGRNKVAPLESEEVDEVQNDALVPPIPMPDEPALPELTLATSATVDTFVTPSETPIQELSPNPNAQETKDGASAEALSTAISDHVSKSTEERAEAELEPPTPTPNSLGFSTSQTAPSDATLATSPKGSPPPRNSHARNTSIASIISEGRGTKTSRPTTPIKRPGSASMSPTRQANFKPGSRPGTPTKTTTASGSRPGTPSKASGTSGSRPSTPSKLATPVPSTPENTLIKAGPVAPPPLPRRAAARNAARTSVTGAPKEDEKAARASLEKVQESIGKDRDVVEEGDVMEEKTSVGQEGKGKAEEVSESTPIGDKPNPARDDSSLVGDIPIITRGSLNDGEVAAPAVNIAPPTPFSADKKDATRGTVVGDHGSGNAASATSTPKSLTIPLPSSPTSRSVPPLPPSLEGPPSAYANSTKPRPPSVISTSSVYSPSVYTTNSGVNGPSVGAMADLSANLGEQTGRHGGEVVKFYVGRETWEERAWLQLVQIREGMFWARLGGVRY